MKTINCVHLTTLKLSGNGNCAPVEYHYRSAYLFNVIQCRRILSPCRHNIHTEVSHDEGRWIHISDGRILTNLITCTNCQLHEVCMESVAVLHIEYWYAYT